MTHQTSTPNNQDAQPAPNPAATGKTPTVLRRARHAIAAIVATASLGALASFPAAADAGGANHLVTAVASAANTDVTRSGMQLASVGAPTVTSANIARAISHDCTGCRAAAAAFQAVFITRNATDIAPANIAAASNANCTACDTFAFAYQYVLTTHGPVYLSGTARQQIADLRQQAADTIASGAPDDQLDAQLQTLAAEFQSIIDQDLKRAGVAARGSVHEHEDIAPTGS